MVRPKGLEPLAHGLGNRCSIHLSYGRMVFYRLSPVRCRPAAVWSLTSKMGKPLFSPPPGHSQSSVQLQMARPEGFEPPTSRFVACHSIQLSYGRLMVIGNKNMAEREGFEPSIQVLAVYSLSRRAPSADSAISPYYLAEEVGFEPTEPAKAQRFSRPPPSTARTPLHTEGHTV